MAALVWLVVMAVWIAVAVGQSLRTDLPAVVCRVPGVQTPSRPCGYWSVERNCSETVFEPCPRPSEWGYIYSSYGELVAGYPVTFHTNGTTDLNNVDARFRLCTYGIHEQTMLATFGCNKTLPHPPTDGTKIFQVQGKCYSELTARATLPACTRELVTPPTAQPTAPTLPTQTPTSAVKATGSAAGLVPSLLALVSFLCVF
jgi:hypothetical protein